MSMAVFIVRIMSFSNTQARSGEHKIGNPEAISAEYPKTAELMLKMISSPATVFQSDIR